MLFGALPKARNDLTLLQDRAQQEANTGEHLRFKDISYFA
jgi:hypothetical protein